MSKKVTELLTKIKNKKEEIINLSNEKKFEDGKKAKEELKELQNQLDLIFDLEDEKQEEIKDKAENMKKDENDYKKQHGAVINAIKHIAQQTILKEEDREIINKMNEETPEDGGLTVPKDIQTRVKELRRTENALETLVNIEPVNTLSGTRIIEVGAEHTPFDNVEEGAEFPEENTPNFRQIDYKVKKKGGILKTTYELLNDSAESVMTHLTKWITKKVRATRNFLILNKIKEMTAGKEVVVTGLDELKDIFNVKLDPSIALTSCVITNQDGYNWLDKLKDNDGNYVLQPNPMDKMEHLLFGKYPVINISNKVMKSKEEGGTIKYPIICGDLKEAITIFDRETLTMEISKEAGDLWGKDLIGIKVRERLDIQAVDEEAVVMGEVSASSAKTLKSK